MLFSNLSWSEEPTYKKRTIVKEKVNVWTNKNFVQEGAAWRGANVPPPKSVRLLEFGPLFSGPGQFIYFLFSVKIYFSFPLSVGGMAPVPPLGDVTGIFSSFASRFTKTPFLTFWEA